MGVRHGLVADWAAKGTKLLGVQAVVASRFERIHRCNLVGMGVLPLQFKDGQDASSLGLTGKEVFDIGGVEQDLIPGKKLTVKAKGDAGEKSFTVTCRIDTPNELDYYRHGGILQYVPAIGAVQEEITFGGARTTAFALQPAVAIAVDVTHATDAPGIEVKEQGKHDARRRRRHRARLDPAPDGLRGASRRCRAGGASPSPSRRPRAARGRTPTRSTSAAPACPDGPRLDRAALHALAGGDGAALRHRRLRAAHRRRSPKSLSPETRFVR